MWIRLLVVLFLCLCPLSVYAEDIYLASASAGAGTGVDCANAKAYTFFNDAGNWGVGAGKISASDTVHICGTITGSANSSLFTFQGSGTAGNVITLQFESGAILQAPYFGANGAININGKNYVKITGYDSTHYGVIKNTDCGTNKTYTLAQTGTWGYPSYGITTNGGSNIEICYLTIDDIYLNVAPEPDNNTEKGWNTADIFVTGSADYSNIKIHHNNLYDAHSGVGIGFEGLTATGIEIYNNLISGHAWGVAAGAGVNNSMLVNILIHDNEITNFNDWGQPYHTDGIILYSNGDTNSYYTGRYYNNYAHGNLMDFSPTGHVGLGCGGVDFLVYNNLFVCEEGVHACVALFNAGGCYTYPGYQPINTRFYNNTVIGNADQVDQQGGFAVKAARPLNDVATHGAGGYLQVRNNIFISWNAPLKDVNSVSNPFAAFRGSGSTDYNIYYDLYNYNPAVVIRGEAAFSSKYSAGTSYNSGLIVYSDGSADPVVFWRSLHDSNQGNPLVEGSHWTSVFNDTRAVDGVQAHSYSYYSGTSYDSGVYVVDNAYGNPAAFWRSLHGSNQGNPLVEGSHWTFSHYGTYGISGTTNNFCTVYSQECHSYLENPLLDANYRLQASSPDHAKSGGADLSAYFTTDKDGKTRTNWSKGAYEYVSAASTSWGHSVSATEPTKLTFAATWTCSTGGTTCISGSGDEEKITLAIGDYAYTTNCSYVGANKKITLKQSYYRAGENVTVKYRTGTSNDICKAASWSAGNTASSFSFWMPAGDTYIGVRVEK